MEFRCPNCHSLVYSGKNKICGVCEKPLPKKLLMSAAEIIFWKKEMDQEEKREKEYRQQINDLGSHNRHGDIAGIAGF
jgi:hypothetical protein